MVYVVIVGAYEKYDNTPGLIVPGPTTQGYCTVLPTSCQYGFFSPFSDLEHGKIGKSGGAGMYGGAGIRVPTS